MDQIRQTLVPQQGGAPGEAGAKTAHTDQIATVDAVLLEGLIKRKGDGG